MKSTGGRVISWFLAIISLLAAGASALWATDAGGNLLDVFTAPLAPWWAIALFAPSALLLLFGIITREEGWVKAWLLLTIALGVALLSSQAAKNLTGSDADIGNMFVVLGMLAYLVIGASGFASIINPDAFSNIDSGREKEKNITDDCTGEEQHLDTTGSTP